jgi:hypothetical protein
MGQTSKVGGFRVLGLGSQINTQPTCHTTSKQKAPKQTNPCAKHMIQTTQCIKTLGLVAR